MVAVGDANGPTITIDSVNAVVCGGTGDVFINTDGGAGPFTYMWSNFAAPGTGSWRETAYYTEEDLMLKLGERGFDPSSFVGGGAPGEVTPVVGAPDGGTISRTDFARAARDKDLMDAADREDYIKELTEQGYRIDPERFILLLEFLEADVEACLARLYLSRGFTLHQLDRQLERLPDELEDRKRYEPTCSGHRSSPCG